MIDLLARVAEIPLFDILRSKEQLAYSVSMNTINGNFKMVGYKIQVMPQENKFRADHVDERIENFRYELISIIEKMSDDNFADVKASLANNKLNEDNTLDEEVYRNWNEIQNGRYEFDIRDKEVEYLSTITKNQLLEFYRQNYGQNERKLSLQIIGNAQASEEPKKTDAEIENSEDLESLRMRFDTLTIVEFTGEQKGNLIRDLMDFKNSLEVCSAVKD